MNDAFAWDIGDLAKFVVLRHLVAPPSDPARLRLGAVWCRTRGAPRDGHGGFVTYLDEGSAYGQQVRSRDPELYGLLQAGLHAGRSIDTTEYRRMLPDDTAHVLDHLGGLPEERRTYWDKALERTSGAEIVFFDPDNGVVAELPRRDRQLYVAYSELEPFLERGQSLVLYQHQNRRSGGLAVLADAHSRWFRERSGRRPSVLAWHRLQARLFIVVPAAEHRTLLDERVASLLSSPWGTEPRPAEADLRSLSAGTAAGPARTLIVLNGPIASGKGTVARELAGIEERAGRRSAVIDLDEVWQMLDHQRPRTGGLAKWLLARNGAALLTDLFFSSGVEVVVCEGPFFTAEERAAYTRHLRTRVTPRFVTLTVPFEESLARALGDPHPGRVISKDPAWLRERYAASSELLEPLRETDLIVETAGRAAPDVAQEIAARTRL